MHVIKSKGVYSVIFTLLTEDLVSSARLILDLAIPTMIGMGVVLFGAAWLIGLVIAFYKDTLK